MTSHNDIENALLAQERTSYNATTRTIRCEIIPPFHPLILLCILYAILSAEESIGLIHQGTLNIQTAAYVLNLTVIVIYFVYKNLIAS